MGQTINCPHNGRHRHGTTTAYKVDRCRCADCSKANTRANARSRLNRLQGTSHTHVPAGEAVTRVRALMRAGATVQGIAAQAGVSTSTLYRILNGEQANLRNDIAATILALHPRDVPNFRARHTSVHGSRLRLQALQAIGYTMADLSRLLNLDVAGIKRLANADAWHAYRDIDAKLARRITRLYDARWNMPPTPGPEDRIGRMNATRAITQAAAKGWVPPLGLDEDRIDDPTYTPNPNHNVHRKAS